MRTEHVKTEMGLFDFDDLIEKVEASVLHKAKKRKERIPFYIKTLDSFGKSLNIETTETNALNIDVEAAIDTPDEAEGSLEESEAVFEKNEIIYNNNLELQKGAQLSQPKQPSEGSYESIWKKPRIRPNIDFEEDMVPDEEDDFGEEEDCAIEAPSIKINRHIYSKYSTQPETQPSSAPEELQEDVPEKMLMSKVENVEFWEPSFTLEEATKMHEDIGSLYCTKEESITDNGA